MRIVEKIKFVKQDGPFMVFTSYSHGVYSQIIIEPENDNDIYKFTVGKEYDAAILRQFTIQKQNFERDKNGDICHHSIHLSNVLFSFMSDQENPLLNIDIPTGAEKVKEVVIMLDKLSAEDRVAVMRRYCAHCGVKTLPCYCNRDD